MTGRTLPTGDKTAAMARIVRGVFDATGRLSRGTDTATAAEVHQQLDKLRARAEALGDASFSASFDAALVQLLPGVTTQRKS